ncbi:MAG TPA: tetratricopeptide repeat protein, partial [Sandaracinaceae bacterium LLY-WYZ-13_1]|nr:tetratricopeptide repeat protein [Sandaracinaceae bacterium LLY-WYZ-13_1]
RHDGDAAASEADDGASPEPARPARRAGGSAARTRGAPPARTVAAGGDPATPRRGDGATESARPSPPVRGPDGTARAPAGFEERAARLTRRAGAALLRGRFSRARSLYRRAVRADDGHAPAWRGLGVASERLGRTHDAVRAYRRYLFLSPAGGDAAVVRARLEHLR